MAVSNLRCYGGLLKPSFAPAPPIAAVASLGVAGTLVWALFRVLCRPDYLPDRPAAIRIVAVALGLDVLWSWLFFAGRHPSVALAAAAALTVAAIVTTWRFAIVDRRAGLILIPWNLATAFAFLLDLSIALRNG